MNSNKSSGVVEITPHKNLISLEELENYQGSLVGKILNIVDASYSDKEQKEALKRLVKSTMWSQFDVVRKWYYDNYSDDEVVMFPFRGEIEE